MRSEIEISSHYLFTKAGQNKLKITRSQQFKQKGAASIIFVMLVSLVIFASSAKTFKEMRNTQEISTAVNAVSHAEPGTKLGAEAFRLYLESQSNNTIRMLPSTIPISTDPQGNLNEFGVVSVQDISVVEPVNDFFEVTATIVNQHHVARSTAKLQVVYTVSTQAGPPPPPITYSPQLSFGTDTTFNGNMTLANQGLPVEVFVDGDLDIGGINLSPLEAIHATGAVTVGSNVEIKSIFSNDDVTLANTKSSHVRSMGVVTATGSAAVDFIQANGDVNITASGRFEKITSRWNIMIDSGGGSQGFLRAGRVVRVNSSGSIDSVLARILAVYNGWFPVGSTVAGKVRCVNKNWTNYGSLSSNEKLFRCPASNGTNVKNWQNVQIGIVPKISALTINDPVIDVWALKSEANYVVEHDSTTNEIRVTVNNVNGLPNGTQYTLADYPAQSNPWGPPYKDYLCEVANSSGQCTNPSIPTVPICLGYWAGAECIQYNSGTNTFSFKPTSLAPGVIWFDGNVHIEDGETVSTILATGNITNKGVKHWAANRGGYEHVCNGDSSKAPNGVGSRHTEAFATHFALNLCDKANTVYTPLATGNISMAAGGVNPDATMNPNSEFTGGNITLDSSDVTGAVLAGNTLEVKGQVTVQGLISAASQLGDGSINKLDGNLTVDFDTIDDFDPLTIPNMNHGGSVNGAGPLSKAATLLWTRPL